MANAVTISKSNNSDIDGMLSGCKWSGTITYSFPDAPGDYADPYTGGNSEPTTSGFASAPSQMQAAINYAIRLILGYTNASIQYAGTNGADVMIAQSPSANPTSYAYYPGNYASGGDVWFGTQYNYSLAQLGNYYFTTALHELGHALGLKHSQKTGGVANVAVPTAHDDSEYTVMSYRSYVGASTTSGYTNEAYGYPQTYMANDILALQTMYGANYTTQTGSTVCSWNPATGAGVHQRRRTKLAPGGGVGGSANRIYETVWDGGGVDTYDLSKLHDRTWASISIPARRHCSRRCQLANLGSGHSASGSVLQRLVSTTTGGAGPTIDSAAGGAGGATPDHRERHRQRTERRLNGARLPDPLAVGGNDADYWWRNRPFPNLWRCLRRKMGGTVLFRSMRAHEAVSVAMDLRGGLCSPGRRGYRHGH